MSTLDDTVRLTIQDFIKAGSLFTALDVSNKVKEVLPLVRHREIRDLVRGLFQSDIETSGYARTPISVTLDDGSSAEALLYHPLSDSWDLDTKYDAQSRVKAASRPSKTISAPISGAAMSANGTITVTSPVVTVKAPVVTVAPVSAAVTSARAQWDQMFSSKPSLFPRK